MSTETLRSDRQPSKSTIPLSQLRSADGHFQLPALVYNTYTLDSSAFGIKVLSQNISFFYSYPDTEITQWTEQEFVIWTSSKSIQYYDQINFTVTSQQTECYNSWNKLIMS